MTNKYIWLIAFLFFLASCQQSSSENDSKPTSEKELPPKEEEIDTIDAQDTIPEPLTVMVLPCSNGYEYNLKMGDLNPSLENYLDQDDSIILKPFPLKKMQGTGYLGVFDKKHCDKILEKVDVDFLIMTRMKGLDFSTTNGDSGNWGYDTKVLDARDMNQFDGISASNLESFTSIDGDIKSKTDELIDMIIESRKE